MEESFGTFFQTTQTHCCTVCTYITVQTTKNSKLLSISNVCLSSFRTLYRYTVVVVGYLFSSKLMVQ